MEARAARSCKLAGKPTPEGYIAAAWTRWPREPPPRTGAPVFLVPELSGREGLQEDSPADVNPGDQIRASAVRSVAVCG